MCRVGSQILEGGAAGRQVCLVQGALEVAQGAGSRLRCLQQTRRLRSASPIPQRLRLASCRFPTGTGHGQASSTYLLALFAGSGSWSGRVHGSYPRFPADFPVTGRRVVLQLRVRRFRCEDVSCGRRTFVEQSAGLTRR
ncbi:transposase family protein [Streptomyces sp. NPDC007157]|uniref:transposase family protein n=1 Tax=Streptomyces sp. NPDC007157 TaxID=3154681 RepID=UPI0033EB7BAF